MKSMSYLSYCIEMSRWIDRYHTVIGVFCWSICLSIEIRILGIGHFFSSWFYINKCLFMSYSSLYDILGMQSPRLLWVHKIIAFAYKFCRLVLDADNTPIVVPFVHTGMQEVMPVGAVFPRVGKTVSSLCSWLLSKLCIPARFLFLGPSSFQDIKLVGWRTGRWLY